MPRFVQLACYQKRVLKTEFSENILVEGSDIPERCTISAGVGKQIDGAAVSIPDNLVCDRYQAGSHRCKMLLDITAGISSILKAAINLRGMKCMSRKMLDESSFVSLLVRLIKSEMGIVLLGRLATIKMNTNPSALTSCSNRSR